jgi:hypothetical protein
MASSMRLSVAVETSLSASSRTRSAFKVTPNVRARNRIAMSLTSLASLCTAPNRSRSPRLGMSRAAAKALEKVSMGAFFFVSWRSTIASSRLARRWPSARASVKRMRGIERSERSTDPPIAG